MSVSTPDISDAHPDKVSVCEPWFRHYGGNKQFAGEIVTVRCFEDNSKVAELMKADGAGKVLVVDGAGSLKRSLLGDMLAEKGMNNGWAGLLINGAVRDVELLGTMAIGVLALNSVPIKTEKKNVGDVNIPVSFAGVTFHPGQYVYADETGILVSAENLLP